MGFSQTQLREGALELLHEEEWSLEPEVERAEQPASDREASRPDSPQLAEREAPALRTEGSAAQPQAHTESTPTPGDRA